MCPSRKLLTFVIFFMILLNGFTQYIKIYDFDDVNGGSPEGSLITDGQYLYGMTQHGGLSTNCLFGDCGIVFRVLPDGTAYEILHDFNENDGSYPKGSLLLLANSLYGMTYKGGSQDRGTIFKMHKDGSGFTRLFNFSDTNGAFPLGSLIYIDGLLYGMTMEGGTNEDGVIFSIKTNGTDYEKIHNFDAWITGNGPYADLIYDGAYLYGMTYGGGDYDKGAVFKIMPDGTNYTKLLDCYFDIGINPWGSLIMDSTYLYGMTYNGGENGFGVIFKIKTDGSDHEILHHFDDDFGSHPEGTLLLYKSKLYGVTHWGGTTTDCSFACGVLFSLNTDGSNYSVLHHFNETTGSNPQGAVIAVPPILYGMTNQDGAHKVGTIYKFDLTGVSDNGNIGDYTLFPNPFSNNLTLTGTSSSGTITIYNMLAQIVYQTSASEGETTIYVGNLPKGGYYFSYTDVFSRYFRTTLIKM